MKRRAVVSVFIVGFMLSLSGQDVKQITILHTNDFHSHLQGYSPETAYTPDTIDGDMTSGGMARIAGIIEMVRNDNPGATLVVDAGDCLMGTLFHALEPTTGFQLPLMKKAGYDVVALGNHDFDYGPGAYGKIISRSAARGEIPVMLLGNGITDPDDTTDDALEDVIKKGLVRQYTVMEINGVKTGIFSLIGEDADDSAPYAPPVKFAGTVKSAKKRVKELKKEGCELIICLSHSGVRKDKKGNWSGEDVTLARKVKGLNLIVSGHTHTFLNEPLIVNEVPIVQTGSGGRYVGRADISVADGKITLENYSMIPVDDNVVADMNIQSEIEKQQLVIDSVILKPLKLEYSMPVVETPFGLGCDEYGDVGASNLGILVADAIYYYMNSEGPGTDIAMVAAGVIRDPVMPGCQSVADIFRTMSLGSGNDAIPGYPLSRLWVTGRELKNILEILIMSSSSTPSHFCFYSHLRIDYDPEAGLFKKVKKLELTDNDGNTSQIDMSKDNSRLYSIVANSYMLDFIGIIKKKSFGLINVVPKDINGSKVLNMDDAVVDFNSEQDGVQEGKEWLALVKYLGTMEKNSDGVPVMPSYYMNPGRSLVNINTAP